MNPLLQYATLTVVFFASLIWPGELKADVQGLLSYFKPYWGGGQVLIPLLAEVCLALVVSLLLFCRGQSTLGLNAVTQKVWLGFLLWALCSAAFGGWPASGFEHWRILFYGWAGTVGLLGLSPAFRRQVILAFGAGVTLCAVVFLLVFMQTKWPHSFPGGNSNLNAAWFLIGFVLCLFGLRQELYKTWAVVGATVHGLALAVCQVDAALACAVLAAAGVWGPRYWPQVEHMEIKAPVVLLVLGALAFWALKDPHYKTHGSLGARLHMTKASLVSAKAHPLMGSGLGTFSLEIGKNLGSEKRHKDYTPITVHPHSEVVRYFGETGGVGGFLYVLLGLALMKAALLRPGYFAVGFPLLIFLQGSVVGAYPMGAWIMMGVGLCAAGETKEPTARGPVIFLARLGGAVFLLIFVLLVRLIPSGYAMESARLNNPDDQTQRLSLWKSHKGAWGPYLGLGKSGQPKSIAVWSQWASEIIEENPQELAADFESYQKALPNLPLVAHVQFEWAKADYKQNPTPQNAKALVPLARKALEEYPFHTQAVAFLCNQEIQGNIPFEEGLRAHVEEAVLQLGIGEREPVWLKFLALLFVQEARFRDASGLLQAYLDKMGGDPMALTLLSVTLTARDEKVENPLAPYFGARQLFAGLSKEDLALCLRAIKQHLDLRMLSGKRPHFRFFLVYAFVQEALGQRAKALASVKGMAQSYPQNPMLGQLAKALAKVDVQAP